MTPAAWTAFITTLRRELPAHLVWAFDTEAARAFLRRDYVRMTAMQRRRHKWVGVVRERERQEQSAK